MDFNSLRKAHPTFEYKKYDYSYEDGILSIVYTFVMDEHTFTPTWRIPCKYAPDSSAEKLIFSLGMVELISYWKCACPPEVVVSCGCLDSTQIHWWKKLYFKGLGEYFYRNGIETDTESFMKLTSSGKTIRNDANKYELDSYLIPVGGGKDSVVTMELLSRFADKCNTFIINPRGATLGCVEVAGLSDRLVSANRTIDKHLIELNAQGYLNGHTPFSAMAAFASCLAAYLNGKKYVVLSNESSANESTISDVNHQYSKSAEFEYDFRTYMENYIPCGVTYFSLLRPYSEFQIARYFARCTKYHGVFKSCNVGSKEDIWCGKCPKCLFVAFMLAPFVDVKKIFGCDILNDSELTDTMLKLIGVLPEKPFECVGSRDEVNAAICLAIEKYKGEKMPYLLSYYEQNGYFAKYRKTAHNFDKYFDVGHFVPSHLFYTFDAMLEGSVFDNRNVVILGFGAEGKSTYEHIKKYSVGASITIADQNEISGDYDAKFCCGENYQSAIYDADIVMKSPGVVLDKLPPEQMAKITSQIELFLEKHRDRVIGITGTKGKSTTASLIYHVLHSVYPDTLFAGNIGLPALDIMPLVKKNGYIVLELSSHQTEYIKVSPKYSAILNFFEEHLDHYGTYEKYIDAKKNIYRYQKPSDIFFCEKSNKSIDNVPSNRYTVGGDVKIWGQKITFEGTSITVDANKVPIKGKHNLSNIAFAFGICSKLGITPEQFENALYTFEPLPHRMEFVGEYGGVKYYNDSIATIPEACMNAVRSIPAVDTLILGGMDRGIDYTELCKFLNKSQISNVIIMPDTDKVIAPMLTKVKNVHTVSSLEEAVEIAKKVTPMGKTCLLSPAASSYNMFKNFAERGNKFKELVKKEV